MLLWGGWGVVSKPLASALSPWQAQTLSTLGLLPVMAGLAFSRNLKHGPHPQRGFWQGLTAGVIGSAGNVACFQALAAGGKAAAVIPLTSLYPLVTILLALVFLGERLNLAQTSGILASLLALVCFNAGAESSLLSPWLAVALLPIALWGVSALFQKLATIHASTELVTFAFLLGFVPVAVLAPLLEPMTWTLPSATWLLAIVLGLCFGLGNLTLIFAYGAGGKASVVTPMASLYSLVTIPLAVTLLGERVSMREGLGIGLALLAVVALSWETKSGLP
jgi:transporter family protein